MDTANAMQILKAVTLTLTAPVSSAWFLVDLFPVSNNVHTAAFSG